MNYCSITQAVYLQEDSAEYNSKRNTVGIDQFIPGVISNLHHALAFEIISAIKSPNTSKQILDIIKNIFPEYKAFDKGEPNPKDYSPEEIFDYTEDLCNYNISKYDAIYVFQQRTHPINPTTISFPDSLRYTKTNNHGPALGA
jgi:uncharacterized protein (UPF0305 family)